MKRLLRVGCGLFINSIIPIVGLILLSLCLKNSNITNIFSITYPFQFIFIIFIIFFATSSLIRQEKENNKNAYLTGAILGIIFCLLFAIISILFTDNYLIFLSLDVQSYKVLFIYSISQQFLNSVFAILIEQYYFEDKEKLATRQLLIFNLTCMIVLVVFALIFKNLTVCTLITLAVELIYVLIFFIKKFKPFKFDFSFIKNLKYSSNDIATNFLMFCIYFFSFHIVFSFGEVYIAASNLVALCTDAFWDSYPIEKVVKVDISKNCFNMKKHFKNSFAYSLIISAISTILFFSIYKFYDVNLKIGLIYLSFQIVDFLLYSYLGLITTYSQINCSATLTTVSEVISYLIRTILSIVVISPFCADIAQIANSVISLLFIIPIYVTYKKKSTKQNI